MANLIRNGDFSIGPVSPVVLVGDEGAQNVPAPGWSVWNNDSGPVVEADLWTSAEVRQLEEINIIGLAADVLARFKRGPDGTAAPIDIVELRTNSGYCGLYQFFDDVPGANAELLVFVIEGGVSAGLGYDGGPITGQSNSTTLKWERIAFSAIAPHVNEFVAYSAPGVGAWFYVANVTVQVNS